MQGIYYPSVIILCLLIVVSAAWFDLRTYKIPNRLNLIGFSAGCCLQIAAQGVVGLFYGFLGGAIPIVALLGLYLLGVLGAGDIKLFAALGSVLEYGVLVVIAIAMLVAAIYGLLAIVCRLIRRKNNGFTRIHFSIPILLATVIYCVGGCL